MTEQIKNNLLFLKEGTKNMFKEFFNKQTNKKQRANMWTFSRLICSFLILICSIMSIILINPILLYISGGITVFGAFTDFLDGKSAKKHNSTSEYGKLLDQVTDKIFSTVVGINLSIFNPFYLITLLGEGIISSINITYKTKYNNLQINSTKTGKIKQWPLGMTLALGFLTPINNILMIISNIAILLTFMMQLLTSASYINQNNKNIQKLSNNNCLLRNIDDNEKNKSLNYDTYKKGVEENKKISSTRLTQYKNLRDVLSEIIVKKEENTTIQKIKKD